MDALTCLLLGRVDDHMLPVGRVIAVFEGQVLREQVKRS